MGKPIEMRWTYKTRDGRPVRILCTDRKGPLPIVALIENDMLVSLFPDGRATNNLGVTPIDLVRCPEVLHQVVQFHTVGGIVKIRVRFEDGVAVGVEFHQEEK